jgi:hypothetical protein
LETSAGLVAAAAAVSVSAIAEICAVMVASWARMCWSTWRQKQSRCSRWLVRKVAGE